MKIVILDAATVTANDISFDCFNEFGEVVAYDLTPEEKLNERISDADMVITNKCVLTATVMEQAKKLYAKTATGNEYAEFMSQNSSK